MDPTKPTVLIVPDPADKAHAVAREQIGAIVGVLRAAGFEIRATESEHGPIAAELSHYSGLIVGSADTIRSISDAAASAGSAILEAVGEGICMLDSDGRVCWSNSEFDRYSPLVRTRVATVCGQFLRNPASPVGLPGGQRDDRRRFDLSVDLSSGPGGDGSGEPAYFEVLLSPISPEASRGLLLTQADARGVAVVRDITVARRRELKLDAINRAGGELVRLDRDLIEKMNTGERLRVLEQKIIKFAHDLLHFDHFAIRLIDERTGKLELVMSRGLPAEAMEVELYARRENNGISGYVAATGRSYICPDTAADPLYVTGIESARSSLTVPLRMSDRVIGIFNVESSRLAAFGEEERQLAELFSTHMALALHLLNLLVIERCNVGQTVTGNVESEVSEPLDDIAQIAAKVKAALAGAGQPGAGPNAEAHLVRQIERILADVDSIRRRFKDVAAGPTMILGADKALSGAAVDPLIVGKRILVADDDSRIRQTVREVLSIRGGEIVAVENGAEAIAALTGSPIDGAGPAGSSAQPGQERPSPATSATMRGFDLLVSDIRLPDKTGYEIFAAARKVSPDLPVILMTGFGYDPHHSVVRASQEGLSCVLFKPFQAERLIEEVHKALARNATT